MVCNQQQRRGTASAYGTAPRKTPTNKKVQFFCVIVVSLGEFVALVDLGSAVSCTGKLH